MGRARCRAIRAEFDEAVVAPVHRHMDRRLAELGVGPLPMPVLDAIETLPDVHLQPTVPSFEYPLAHVPPALAFVGALPPPATTLPLPGWAREVEAARRVVLVTQGTFANADLGQLIAPTLAALADEPDTLVVATTGGRPVDAIPGPIPGNARLAEYLPFDWLLPRVDLLVTNGGYGTVNMALKAGVPMVVAGQADDKVEIAARVAWSGAGINLATDHPTSRVDPRGGPPGAERAAVPGPGESVRGGIRPARDRGRDRGAHPPGLPPECGSRPHPVVIRPEQHAHHQRHDLRCRTHDDPLQDDPGPLAGRRDGPRIRSASPLAHRGRPLLAINSLHVFIHKNS